MNKLEKGQHYRVDYGYGHEDNFIIGKLRGTDVCHYFWEKPYYKKWKQYEEFSHGGYSVLSCRSIRLATDEEISKLKQNSGRSIQ